MKIGLQIPDYTWGGSEAFGPTLVRIAEAAEEAGFELIGVPDHLWQVSPCEGGRKAHPRRSCRQPCQAHLLVSEVHRVLHRATRRRTRTYRYMEHADEEGLQVIERDRLRSNWHRRAVGRREPAIVDAQRGLRPQRSMILDSNGHGWTHSNTERSVRMWQDGRAAKSDDADCFSMVSGVRRHRG
jgi:hypothetical protein